VIVGTIGSRLSGTVWDMDSSGDGRNLEERRVALCLRSTTH
jgi:hypothetical protein